MINNRGIIHFIPLFLILVGIIAGVYLVQQTQIFKPRAAAVKNIEFSSSPGKDPVGKACRVFEENGVLKSTCPTVNIKFTSPLETDQRSNLPNFNLIKTALAADFIYDGVCLDNDKGKIFNKTITDTVDTCPQGTICKKLNDPAGAVCIDSFGSPVVEGPDWYCSLDYKNYVFKNDSWFKDTAINCPTGRECNKTGNKVTCIEPGGQQPTLGKPVHILPKDKQILGFGADELIGLSWSKPDNAKRYRVIINSDADARKNVLNTCGSNFAGYFGCWEKYGDGNYINQGVINITIGNRFQETTYQWWVDALDENGNKIGTSDGTEFILRKPAAAPSPVSQPSPAAPQPTQPTQPTQTTVQPRPTASIVPAPARTVDPTCGTSCIYSQIDADGVTRCYSGNCLDGSNDCSFNNNCGYLSACSIAQQEICPGAEDIGKTDVYSPVQCDSGQNPGSVTQAQAECVLKTKGREKDILSLYERSNWCIDQSNWPAIINNWNGINNDQDKSAVRECFASPSPSPLASPSTAPITTSHYRFGENINDLYAARYITYTTGGIVVPYNFKDTTSGSKYIFVQFKYSNGVETNPYTAQIVLLKQPKPDKLTASCSVSSGKEASLDDAITYQVSAAGGNGTYKYQWTGDLSGDTDKVVKKFDTPGLKSATVIVSSGEEIFNARCITISVINYTNGDE